MNEIQDVIDSLSKKDYHKGFDESYNKINDVVSFDSSNMASDMSINSDEVKSRTKRSMSKHLKKV